MKFISFLFSAILVSVSVAGIPQEQIITGTVTDAVTGEPLTGVNVLIEGSITGVPTDENGNYRLPKPSYGAILLFSYVGYSAERIKYTDQLVIDVKLTQSIQVLDSVVVIGYGTVRKSDLTGAVVSISSKDIEKALPANIQSALQGRAAGLMVTSNDGSPGNEAMIRIRGIGTLNNNNPLYVVDGMLIDNSDKTWTASFMGFLNPRDIASIEVLKDASAQAIYGSRGANGVILITTRKGTEGTPQVRFSTSLSYETIGKTAEMLNADEYKDFILTSYYNGYMRLHPGADPDILPDTLNPTTREVVAQYNLGYNTDWYKEILNKNRLSENYDLSLSGGTKDIHYSANAGYLDKKGLLLNSEYKRYTFRLNTDYKVRRNIRLGENLGVSSSVKTGDWNYTSIMRKAMWGDPISPVLKPDSLVSLDDPDYKYNKYAPLLSGETNPVTEAAILNYNASYLTLLGNLFAEADILRNLKLRSNWGFEIYNKVFSTFTPRYNVSPSPGGNNSSTKFSMENFKSNCWVWENTLTWNKKIKNHSLIALLGYTSEYTRSANQTASKQGAPGNEPELQTFDAATSQPLVSGTYNVFTMISMLGRVNYSFLERYYLTASIRRDGSSKFGAGHRWGTFPSFSLGWKINNENFFKSFGAEFIDALKLRVGWGQIGNSSLPVYNAFVSQVSSKPIDLIDTRYIFGGEVKTGYSLSTIGTPNISWETTEQTNIGLDLAFLKNTLSLTADFFIKNTRDMLMQIPVPGYSGYPSTAAPYTNIGAVRNTGIEILVNWQGGSEDFSYGIGMNLASFNNKVLSLGPGNKPIIGNSGIERTEVGSSIGRFYGYVTDGIFQSDEDVLDYKGPDSTVLQPHARAGDFRFKNMNGDETIDGNDMTWMGSPWPKLLFGLSVNLGYKAFDLTVFFQGSYGNKIFDAGRMYASKMGKKPSEFFFSNAWRGAGTSNTVPILTTNDENDNYRISDFFVENGSYIRLKNIQIGYNLPKAFCDRMKISNSRLWIGGTDLLTFTKYRGNDPEIGTVATPTSSAGFDNDGYYPKPREISLGLTISF